MKSSKIFVSDTKGQFIRIDQNDYKIKYLAKISDTEEDEIISNITWIDRKILSKGVWVHISLALPYKTLTKQQAIDMIKSVEVVRGFDMEIK